MSLRTVASGVGPIGEMWCFHNKANSNKHKLFCWPPEDLPGATVLSSKHSLSRTPLLRVGELDTAAMGLLCIQICLSQNNKHNQTPTKTAVQYVENPTHKTNRGKRTRDSNSGLCIDNMVRSPHTPAQNL